MMMMIALLFSVIGLFLSFASGQTPTIYSIVVTNGAGIESKVSTVQVLNDGSLVYLVDNILSTTFYQLNEGFSAFDQKNKVFYFAANYRDSYIYISDIPNKTIHPPLVTDLEGVYNINWDGVQDAVYIDGYIYDNRGNFNFQIYQYSTIDRSINYITTLNATINHSTVDGKNGWYYFVGYDSLLYSLQIANPTNILTVPLQCSDAKGNYTISYLYYDNVNQQLIGVGESNQPYVKYGFLTISTKGSCKVTPTNLPLGVAISYAYNPVNQNLYVGFAGPIALYTFDTKEEKLTELDVSLYLRDLAVAF